MEPAATSNSLLVLSASSGSTLICNTLTIFACQSLDAPNTILDLQLKGRLREEESVELTSMLNAISPSFLHFSQDRDIASVLDAAAIANRFADGTFPSALLQALLSDDAHPGDAHIALDIIESLKS